MAAVTRVGRKREAEIGTVGERFTPARAAYDAIDRCVETSPLEGRQALREARRGVLGPKSGIAPTGPEAPAAERRGDGARRGRS